MNIIDMIFERAERMPWHAATRMAIGFSLIPLYTWWRGNTGADWRLLPFFLSILVALRIVPAVLRHLFRFSPNVQAEWAYHRVLAKRYDSYQWRKLLWFGLGLAGFIAAFGDSTIPGLLALGCLLAGSLGALVWRVRCSNGLEVAAPAAMPRDRVTA